MNTIDEKMIRRTLASTDAIKLSDQLYFVNGKIIKSLNRPIDSINKLSSEERAVAMSRLLTDEEKKDMLKKFELIGDIDLDGVLTPIDLIVDGKKLERYSMNFFPYSLNVAEYFRKRKEVKISDLNSIFIRSAKILKGVHDKRLIYQDVSNDNILVSNRTGEVAFCDFESCAYKSINGKKIIEGPFYSRDLSDYIEDYKDDYLSPSTNNDRLSLLLAYLRLIFGENIPNISEYKYDELSDRIHSLRELKNIIEALKERDAVIPEIPYLDDVLEKDESYIITH